MDLPIVENEHIIQFNGSSTYKLTVSMIGLNVDCHSKSVSRIELRSTLLFMFRGVVYWICLKNRFCDWSQQLDYRMMTSLFGKFIVNVEQSA